MKTKLIVLMLGIGLSVNIHAQKTKLRSWNYNEYKMSSFYIAANLQEAYKGLDKMVKICLEEKHDRIYFTYYFNSKDTIFEIIKIDSSYYKPLDQEPLKYLVNISTGLKNETYIKLIEYLKKITMPKKDFYCYSLYMNFVDGIKSCAISMTDSTNLSAARNKEIDELNEKVLIYAIESGSVELFELEFYREKYITDRVCKAAIGQLKDPKYPSYLCEQYMEINKRFWDPAKIDTSGIPKQYKEMVKKEWLLNFNACSRKDSLYEYCKDCITRLSWFMIYDEKGKSMGLTAQEALYKELADRCYYCRYKNFTYMIDYAIDNNDNRLLPAIKKFIEEHPDYKLTEKQKTYFSKK